jgi:hypothetical protein
MIKGKRIHIYMYRWIYVFINKCIPFTFLQAWMIEKHFALCPICKEEYADDGLRGPIGFTAQGGRLPETDFREIEARIDERLIIPRHRIRPVRRRRLQMVAGTLVLIVLVPLFLFVKERLLKGDVYGEEFRYRDIIIRNVSVEKKPANVIYFQPEQPDQVIVWINKRDCGEETGGERLKNPEIHKQNVTGADNGSGQGEPDIVPDMTFEKSEESSAM